MRTKIAKGRRYKEETRILYIDKKKLVNQIGITWEIQKHDVDERFFQNRYLELSGAARWQLSVNRFWFPKSTTHFQPCLRGARAWMNEHLDAQTCT